MRTPSIVIGLLGGVVVSAVLAAPLYFGLPSRYLVDWPYVSTEGSMYGFLGAMVLAIVTGFVAAWRFPEESVRSGTAAGLVAAVVACVLVVLPAAALQSCSDLLSAIQRDLRSADLRALLADALVSVAWLPTASGVATLCAGPAFGAVGGVCFDLWRGMPARTHRDVHWTPVPIIGLFSGVVWVVLGMLGAHHLATHVLPEQLGYTLTWIDRLKLSVPASILLLGAGGLLAWALRDAVLLVRSGRRLRGLAWGAAGFGAALITFVGMGVLFPTTWTSPLTWSAAVVGTVAAVVTLVAAPRSDEYLDMAPRTFADLVIEALLGSLVVVGPGLLAGGTAAMAIGVVLWPYVQRAVPGADLAARLAEPLVFEVFQVHWIAGAGLFFLAGAGLVVRLPLWLFARAVAQRVR